MDLMFIEDNQKINDEEKENLKNNIIKIEKIIAEKNILKKSNEEERDNYRNDYENSNYFKECNSKVIEIIDEIEELNEIIESPYFGRLVFDCENDKIDFYIGNKSVRDEKNDNIIYDWRAPVASVFYSNQLKFKYNNFLYNLKLKRKLLIEKKELISCREVYNSADKNSSINDNFLKTLILKKKEQDGFTDIIRSIQDKQNDIIRAPLKSNIICQGSAGSGKTAIIVHRISYLLFNHANISADKFLFIAPNENFKKELNELNKKLEIDKITIKTINEYYLNKINEYINMDATELLLIESVDGDLEEKDSYEESDILAIFEKIKLLYVENIEEYAMFYNIKYDSNVLPLNNGKKIYTHILEQIKKIDKEKNNIKNNFRILLDYLIKFQLTNLEKIEIPQNYREEFFIKIDNKINDKNEFIESFIDKKFDEQECKKIIDEINSKLEENNSKIKIINKNIRELDSFLLKLIKKSQIEELKKELEKIENDNALLIKNRDAEVEKIEKYEEKEVQEKELIELKEIKDFWKKIFEIFDIISNNQNKYEIQTNDFIKFKYQYNKLIKQMLLDESKISYRQSISDIIENIKASIKLIDIEKEKNHDEKAANLRKEISPRNVIEITLNTVFNKKLSKYMNITRYEVYLILRMLNMFGFRKNTKYNYLYVDEAQDYKDSEIKLIKDLEDCYMNIFGDINQNIKGECFQRENWDALRKCLGQATTLYELNENYRNTINVVNFCNENLKTDMLAVGVEGNNVEIKTYTNLFEVIEDARENNLVIITDNEEYQDEIKQHKGLRVFSVKDSKGLEFQNIIVIDENLNNNSKYIAYTRTLNNLKIYRKK